MKKQGPSKELLIWYINLKKSKSCARCGLSFAQHPEVMDYDHQVGTKKKMNVSAMIRTGMTKESILKEIAKCIPLCSNCHRICTSERRKNKQRRIK